MEKQKWRKWFLREHREERGWTQEELSAHSGISRSRISELETGSERYNQDVLEALAAALSTPEKPVTPGDLLDRDPTQAAPIFDLWDRIPESERARARRVMESFTAEFEIETKPNKLTDRKPK